MTQSTLHRQAGIGRAALIAYLLAAGVASLLAVALWSTGDTNAPVLQAPAAGAVVTGTANGASAAFEWNHGSGIPGNRNPLRASDFVVCVLAAGQECAWPGTFPAGDSRQPLHAWTARAESLQRTALVAPPGVLQLFRPLNPRLDTPYRYTFAAPGPIPLSDFSRALAWTVGACNDQTNARCSHAPPRPIRFAQDINLEATDEQDDFFANVSLLKVDGLARNIGGVDSGEFKVEMRLYELLLDAAGQPRKDINAPGIGNSAEVVLTNGKLVPIAEAPRKENGQFDIDQVYGILVPESNPVIESATHPGLPPGQSDIGVIHLEHTVGTARPTRFAVSFTVDFDGVISETDESDNTNLGITSLIP